MTATGKEVNVPYSGFIASANGEMTALRIDGLADGLVHQIQGASGPRVRPPRP